MYSRCASLQEVQACVLMFLLFFCFYFVSAMSATPWVLETRAVKAPRQGGSAATRACYAGGCKACPQEASLCSLAAATYAPRGRLLFPPMGRFRRLLWDRLMRLSPGRWRLLYARRGATRECHLLGRVLVVAQCRGIVARGGVCRNCEGASSH